MTPVPSKTHSRPILLAIVSFALIACGGPVGTGFSDAGVDWVSGVYDVALIEQSRTWQAALPTSYPATGGHTGQRVRVFFNQVAEPTYRGTNEPVTLPVGSIVAKHVVATETTPLSEATRVYFMRKEPAGYDTMNNDWSWGVANRTGTTWSFSTQGRSAICSNCHQLDRRWDFARSVQVFRSQTPP